MTYPADRLDTLRSALADRYAIERELTANLQHPHILPLFDSGSANGLLYYVIPYVEGETLRRRIAFATPQRARRARRTVELLETSA